MTLKDIKPKVKKAVEESIDKGIEIGIKAKEYLVDDTLNDLEKIVTIKKEIPPKRCGICNGIINGEGNNWNESQGVVIHNECPTNEGDDLDDI